MNAGVNSTRTALARDLYRLYDTEVDERDHRHPRIPDLGERVRDGRLGHHRVRHRRLTANHRPPPLRAAYSSPGGAALDRLDLEAGRCAPRQALVADGNRARRARIFTARRPRRCSAPLCRSRSSHFLRMEAAVDPLAPRSSLRTPVSPGSSCAFSLPRSGLATVTLYRTRRATGARLSTEQAAAAPAAQPGHPSRPPVERDRARRRRRALRAASPWSARACPISLLVASSHQQATSSLRNGVIPVHLGVAPADELPVVSQL